MPVPKTQQNSTAPLSDQTRTATGCSQWLLESAADAKTPVFHFNALDVFVCGKESFGQIADDIRAARKSIDIIAYGFDPAMELERGAGGTWPRGGKSATDTGTTYGALLRAAAARGVKVRLLVWYDPVLKFAAGNMPGYKSNNSSKSQPGDTYARGADVPLGRPAEARRDHSPQALRENFNANWYNDTAAGRIEGLSLRTRGAHHADVVASLKAETGNGGGPRTAMENITLELAATHHQKTIVIDYDDTTPKAKPVAYVMGLNSLTDYWDTPAHTFNDPLRGQNFEGDDKDHSVGKGWESASSGQATLKPYQDFVCRIQGQAIAAVFKNFVQAWNIARQEDACAGSNDARSVELKSVPKNLTQNLKGPYQRAQIVRTLPSADGASEHAIERTYYQAASFARHYIYIENQYFQHTDWVRNLKAARQKFVQDLGAAKQPVASVPTLHLMAVIPTPERGQMVPRTHDVVTELGFGDSVPEQDKRIKQELADHARYERDLADYQSKKKSFEAKNLSFPVAPPYKQPLSELAQAQQTSGGDKQSAAVRQALTNTLGLRALVCSLWAYDATWSLANTKVGQQADQEQRDYENAQRQWDRQQADRSQAGARDRQAGGWGPPADHSGIARPGLPSDRSKALKQATAQRYREVYIHSKLMVIDDSFFTLGSANLNVRSFAVDSEINIASDNQATATDLRQRVWSQHTQGLQDMDGGGNATKQEVWTTAFEKWERHANANFDKKRAGKPLSCFLVKFYDERTSTVRFG